MQHKRMRMVTLKNALTGYAGNAFASSGRDVEASIQPMSGDAAAKIYGLTPSEMRLMLANPGMGIVRGMGVCVDVAADAEPDYRVVYAADWSRHTVVHLRFIPEGERGVSEL